MAAAKLQRILEAIVDRVETITSGSGIGANVLLTRQEPQEDQLPAALIYLSERSAEETKPGAARASQQVTVIGYREYSTGDQPELLGIEILGDIQTAIESDDETLGGLLTQQYGLSWASDEIFLPESGASVVAAKVVYNMPHIRRAGNPEIE